MPSDDFLGDRKKALEDSFFAKQNQRLVEELRVKRERESARAELVEITGLDDASLLDQLVELEIGPDTWTAISLVPLVEVAWADGVVEDKERRAVLAAAEESGFVPGSASYILLEGWLTDRPGPGLLQAWGEYIVTVCGKMEAEDKAALREQIMGRARRVAAAAGGILGLGNKVSAEERAVLDELDKAFA